MRVIDLTGERFGKLAVIKRANTKKRNVHWVCRCECGNETIVNGDNLRRGLSKSCGCFKYESRNATHHLSKTPIYRSWANMKKRCNDTNDENYGGRGITYCDKWETFDGFFEDMGSTYKEGLTIDRIDVNGNYCKENCRWADNKEQANNKRNNHIVEYNGERLTLVQFCVKYNVNYKTVSAKLIKGYTPEQALLTTTKPYQVCTRRKRLA